MELPPALSNVSAVSPWTFNDVSTLPLQVIVCIDVGRWQGPVAAVPSHRRHDPSLILGRDPTTGRIKGAVENSRTRLDHVALAKAVGIGIGGRADRRGLARVGIAAVEAVFRPVRVR